MSTYWYWIYELHLNDKDTLTKVCYAYIKNIKMSQYIYDLLKDDNDEDIIMEIDGDDWLKNIPEGTLVAMQGRNGTLEEFDKQSNK